MSESPASERSSRSGSRPAANAERTPPPKRPPVGRQQDPPIRPGGTAHPTTVFVGGECRPVVNGVAFALAELLDLTPFWLDVRDPAVPSDGPDPGTTGWIPPDRLFVSEGGKGLEASVLASSDALWTLVRADEPESVLTLLTDFLRLPEVIQEIVGTATSNGGPKAVVAANSDRFAHLFPRTAAGLQRFLQTLEASSLSIIAAHTGRTGPGRFGFRTVFRVDVESSEKWMEGTITCEQGIDHGPFAVGRSNRLSDVPSIARVCLGLFAKPR